MSMHDATKTDKIRSSWGKGREQNDQTSLKRKAFVDMCVE